jgi:hypothetical protein
LKVIDVDSVATITVGIVAKLLTFDGAKYHTSMVLIQENAIDAMPYKFIQNTHVILLSKFNIITNWVFLVNLGCCMGFEPML